MFENRVPQGRDQAPQVQWFFLDSGNRRYAVSGMETVGGRVVVRKVFEVGGGLVMKASVV